MRKSKLDGVLKGIAVAGLAVGGASVVQSGDVVFAKELEYLNESDEQEQLLSEEFLAASTSASASEYASEEYAQESEDTSLAEESESLVDIAAEAQSGEAESATVTAEVVADRQQMPNMVMAGMQVEAEPVTVKTENVDPAEEVQTVQQEEKETVHTSEYTAETGASSEAVQAVSKTEETVVSDTRQSAAETAQIADASEQIKTVTTKDEKVPLAVREENIANTRYEEQKLELEENQTPLAANLQSEKSRSLFAVLPAVAAVIAGKTIFDRKTGKILKRKE